MAVAHPAVTTAPAEARSARTVPGTLAIAGLVFLSLAVVLVLLYALWEFWPTAAILDAASARSVHIFGVRRLVTPEVRLLVIVALAGALGGLMHSTRSFAWYVGHQELKWRWVPYYLVTVVVGAGLASIFYLVIRGGVLGGKATTADTNPYGFAALGALVGLFTEQALEMLRRAADQIFAVAPRGKDSTPPGPTSAGRGNGGGSTGGPSVGDGGSSTSAMSTDATSGVGATTGGASTVDTTPARTAANGKTADGAPAGGTAPSSALTGDVSPSGGTPADATTDGSATGGTGGGAGDASNGHASLGGAIAGDTTAGALATAIAGGAAAGVTATGVAAAGGSPVVDATAGAADGAATAAAAPTGASTDETSLGGAGAGGDSTTTVFGSDGSPTETSVDDTTSAATATPVAEMGTRRISLRRPRRARALRAL